MQNEMAGQTLHLVMDDGNEYVARFLDGQTLAWAGRGEPFGSYQYQCAKVAEEAYLICFLLGEGDAPVCLTAVLDLRANLVTIVVAVLGANRARPRLTSHQITFGTIKRPGLPLPVIRHAYTADLVGKKIAWSYSPAVTLTHIYLTEHYLRGSLKNMPPPPEDLPEAQRLAIADRAKRWGELFFEEPCFYVKIRQSLYLLGMIEDFRNRVDPNIGGGDMVFVVNTDLMQDFLRTVSASPGQPPVLRIGTAHGRFVEEPDEMEIAKSPYRVE